MRKPLVAGNWKLNGNRGGNAELVGEIVARVGALDGIDVMVCPPFVYLDQVRRLLEGSAVLLGAQNLAIDKAGAFTGEVSGTMLLDVGCSMVIVGHSERRARYGETDEIVAKKYEAAIEQGIAPVLCVGETLDERESGTTMTVIERQIKAVVEAAGIAGVAAGAVAYEPVWAIGTGRTASPEQAQEVHAHIRSIIAAASAKIARDLRILYGGSVKGSNASALFAMGDIDGGLIGGASLDAADFAKICEAAAGN